MLVALEWDEVSMVAPKHSSIGTSSPRPRSGLGQWIGASNRRSVTRPPSVPDRRRRDGVIGCMSWAEAAHRPGAVRRVTALPLCAAWQSPPVRRFAGSVLSDARVVGMI